MPGRSGGSVWKDIDATIRGYNALFQVFLTHSALERYLVLIGVKLDALEPVLSPHGPNEVVDAFFRYDSRGKLFEFLHARINNRLKDSLLTCKNGSCTNVGDISASIRHVFAHGHLTANANGQSPRASYKACMLISDFLLGFIDDHFSETMADYCRRGAIEL